MTPRLHCKKICIWIVRLFSAFFLPYLTYAIDCWKSIFWSAGIGLVGPAWVEAYKWNKCTVKCCRFRTETAQNRQQFKYLHSARAFFLVNVCVSFDKGLECFFLICYGIVCMAYAELEWVFLVYLSALIALPTRQYCIFTTFIVLFIIMHSSKTNCAVETFRHKHSPLASYCIPIVYCIISVR